jgi:hypothetical protein
MINLLPAERKRDIRAARTNVTLIIYNIVTFGAIVILGVFSLTFYILVQNKQASALSTTEDNNKKTAALNGVRLAADSYRNDLSFAKQVIGKSVSYTDVIIAITKLMPDGAILDSLSIQTSNFSQQTSFQAHTTSYEVGEDLKQNFQSSKIFSNVYFESLSRETSNQSSESKLSHYPVTVSMSAKFNPESVFNEK